MTTSFVEQRRVLRLRLQAQREVIALEISKMEFDQNEFPRSITMRLLIQPQSFPMLVFKEILPLLVRQFFNSSRS